MPSTADIIRDAEALPVEERVLIVDTLLRTLHPPDPDMDRLWAAAAKRRRDELRSGKVAPVPGGMALPACGIPSGGAPPTNSYNPQ